MIRARLESPQRTVELKPEAAILVADGKVHAACQGEADAFELWLVLTEWMIVNSQPSQAWQALHRSLALGRAAKAGDRRAQSLPDYNSASTVLNLAKEILGPDAYAKLRKGIADRMLGRS